VLDGHYTDTLNLCLTGNKIDNTEQDRQCRYQRNTVLHNHCCHRKAIIFHIHVLHHENRMRHVVICDLTELQMFKYSLQI
jgi:hypothetical protein